MDATQLLNDCSRMSDNPWNSDRESRIRLGGGELAARTPRSRVGFYCQMIGDNVVAFAVIFILTLLSSQLRAEPQVPAYDAEDWLTRFRFEPVSSEVEEVGERSALGLPRFAVAPAAPGPQLVRVSLPFAPGTYPAELGVAVREGDREIVPDIRVLTHHPGRPVSVRRAILSFVYDFSSRDERAFTLVLHTAAPNRKPEPARTDSFRARIGSTELTLSPQAVHVARADGTKWEAEFIAPARSTSTPPLVEVIEQGEKYLWVRMLVPDAVWPRIVELRADALGMVALRGHLQRLEPEDGTAPDVGWRVTGPRGETLFSGDRKIEIGTAPVQHVFAEGMPGRIVAGPEQVGFPDAHLLRRGLLDAENAATGLKFTYMRCRATDQVPHQPAAWRTATLTLGPGTIAPLSPLLEPPHQTRIAPEAFAAIYHDGELTDLAAWPLLAAARQYHIDAMAGCSLLGDDFGNVTHMPKASFLGMNRLNHCPAILSQYYQTGDARLRATAVHWCENFHDLSIWWGTAIPDQFGGTRYNDIHQRKEHLDKNFMWRSNKAVNFCTKGFDTFFFAYEETGDPRMSTSLRWQTRYAAHSVHADRGECRNIGDVIDFVRLYSFTHRREYLDNGLRLFRELRTKLSEGDLFSQGGQPIEKNPPFIEDDAIGLKHPFAKPYILGYALEGLPALAAYVPDEPKLRDAIRAVADFQAQAQDPVGGWRYPHPRSGRMIISQGVEHAAQVSRAAAFLERRGEPIENLLDAIERVLQARLLFWQRTGQFLDGLGNWEAAAANAKDTRTLAERYARPEDRDASRDYTEGSIAQGGSSPEGVVYFSEELDFYLAHRPAERLFNANPFLQKVLDRTRVTTDHFPSTRPAATYPPYGVERELPTFRDAAVKRLTFPLRFVPGEGKTFAEWRSTAREKLLKCLLTPPPRAEFSPALIAREDRGSYEARKIAFNVSADCRVPAYLLIPKGKGPFPAAIALHDHGAHFLIGKEKVIRPFGVTDAIRRDAEQWVGKSYGGRFIGDELAKRGYVVFSMDALFWGERGRKEGIEYTAQQALSSNLLQMGMSWVGVMTWDDVRSAEFVASLPEVDPSRIGAVGLSVGCHRTWMLSAVSDRVKAGVAICWMGTTSGLTAPGNNQTKGHSAYSMLVPNLRNLLDYPDVAAIACPKPMLFFNGEKDGLFPVSDVNAAYQELRHIWEGQGAGDQLVTRLWPVPHEFSVDMQQKAFDWLDKKLSVSR